MTEEERMLSEAFMKVVATVFEERIKQIVDFRKLAEEIMIKYIYPHQHIFAKYRMMQRI